MIFHKLNKAWKFYFISCLGFWNGSQYLSLYNNINNNNIDNNNINNITASVGKNNH